MSTSTKLSSGMTLEGTDQTISMASSLLDTTNANRCCAISIANATKCPLRSPLHYLHHGSVLDLPDTIPPGKTGLILTQEVSDDSLSGVITYEIGGTFGYQQLQVMWRVAFDLDEFGNRLNIGVGPVKAGVELYQDLVSGRCGSLVVPGRSNTPFAFPVVEFCFDIRAVMNGGARTPLAVYFGPYDMSSFYSLKMYN